MNSKSIIWICMSIGSAAGSYIPLLWGSDYFSFSSVFFTAVGGILGVWVGYRINTY
jgi:hypothetical protein